MKRSRIVGQKVKLLSACFPPKVKLPPRLVGFESHSILPFTLQSEPKIDRPETTLNYRPRPSKLAIRAVTAAAVFRSAATFDRKRSPELRSRCEAEQSLAWQLSRSN